jgi:hypothetical protein
MDIKKAYKNHQANKLMEARVALLEKGVYPFDVFLKESSEAVNAAEKIEKLEEVAALYKNNVPTLYMFVSQTSNVLLEGKAKPAAIKAAMVNYAFIAESLNKCVNEAAGLLLSKVSKDQSLYNLYKNDAVQLLEFCIKKAQAYKLLEGNSDPVIKNLATELSKLPLSSLIYLCENTPSMRLYVSNKLHTNLANTIING